MKSWTVDLAHAVFEAILDLLDGFASVRPRVYLVTAVIVFLVTMFAAFGPRI